MENKGKEGAEGSPESAFRLWGEERDDDIVYSVYLKKVSYKKSAADASCVQHDWEALRIRTIKAASVQRLVEYLPMAVEDMDSVYINVFLSTYQTFTTLKEALGMLLKRYIEVQETATESEKDRQLKNIRSVVMMWLEENHDDFREPPDYPCLHMIEEFARDVSQDVELHLRTQLLMTSFENEDSPKKLSPDERPKFQFSLSDEVDFMMLGRMGYHDIREIDSQLIAEQLTQMEADLFRKVIPQHCLGSIWSRRDKKHGVDPTTVAATVNQFNDITMRVMSTIVEDKSLRPMGRGLIITKWIDVAQSCRELKNFSALKAIISALQSHPIHRLRRSWSAVPKASTILFEDLANIFLDDNNFETWREIINKEGTAKFATVSPRSSKKVTRSLRKMMSSDKLVVQRRDSWHGKVNGTVPYLGTFLSDLIKIDTAYPDTVEDGLINFEKKRKEFEVIAQIRLLQMSSKSYQIQPDDKFMEWFNDMKVLSYQECCKLSDELQSPNMMTSSAPPTPTLVKTEKTKTYRATDVCEPMRTLSVHEVGNQDEGSDNKGCRDLLDTSLYPSESQEYSQLPSLPSQVTDRPESPQPTHCILSSPIQAPQSTAELQHSYTQPLPHQGSDSKSSMPTSTHHLSQTDLTRTSEYVDNGGKDLSIPSYGFILSIPPGALEEGSRVRITCEALPSLPDHLKLNNDELIVSPGYQCFPSGLHFKEPVKLVIPHCGAFNDPSRVRTVLIPTDSQSTGEFLRTPLTQDVCKVNHGHFELSLQHFSGGQVVPLYDVLAVKGKHMLCMPYLEKIMPTSRIPIMEFCLRNKPHDPALIETHRTDHITQYVKDEEDEIFVKYKDLEVNCLLDEDEINKTISYRVLFSKPKHQEYFHLNLKGKANDSSVKLELLQETEKIQEILFRTRFTGDPEEQSQSSSLQESCSSSTTRSSKREAPCTESTVTDNISGIPEKQMQLSRPSLDHDQTSSILTPGVSSSAVDPKETSKPPREVSELEYHELSCKIGQKGFHPIGIRLGTIYEERMKVLLKRNDDYTEALLELFMTWNIQQQQESTDIREVLAVKLEESKLGMLADKLRRGCLV